ncbi:hypothetical protein DFR49_0713 [Hephaestia caeni]|uniref:Uncharacterized protein n=1 Tax=Hephaestia caeni TaxID=645617 RepID=A0A397P9E8_9SPHN|nr:hypothetical protein [Hephaestia caeni]RIA46180.1 hypothetical protein DFR49_0713 [Hephaestia caeni]
MPDTTNVDGQDLTGTKDYFSGIAELLRTLGVEEARFGLSGGGDDGEASIELVRYRDGREEFQLPTVPVRIGPTGQIFMLDGYLHDRAADVPEGDWVNNEGGFGSVTFFPFAVEPDERVECDMTYREDGDYGDDDDDLDLADDPDDADLPLEIVVHADARP